MINKSAFTLIELLVVVSIIGILATFVTFSLRQAQESSRDGKRKADLETIATGLELYRAECTRYPASISFGGSLVGDDFVSTCSSGTAYITAIPSDPKPGRTYSYVPNGTRSSYVLCTSLEQGGAGVSGCGAATACGSGVTCNYKISRP